MRMLFMSVFYTRYYVKINPSLGDGTITSSCINQNTYISSNSYQVAMYVGISNYTFLAYYVPNLNNLTQTAVFKILIHKILR